MSIIRIMKKDKDTKARLGILSLPHGEVETPAFMPVGTNGTVKELPIRKRRMDAKKGCLIWKPS